MYILVAIAILVITFGWIALAIKIVPQHHVGVVERIGRFKRLIKPGLNMLIPFIDQVRKYQDTRIQKLNLPSQVVITKDNVEVQIDSTILYQVVEPMQATYGMSDLVYGLGSLNARILQQIVGRLEMDENFISSGRISLEAYRALKEAAEMHGIRVESVDVTSLNRATAREGKLESVFPH